MKNKIMKILGFILVVIIVGASKAARHTNKGEAATIDMNGTKVTINETKVDDVLNAGYGLTNSGIYEVPKTVDKKTYTDDVAAFSKDEMNYANVAVANVSGSSEKIESCKIIEMTFDYDDAFIIGKKVTTYKDALINGFNPKGMTKDEIKEKISKEVKEEDDKKLIYEDGDYYSRYYFNENGELTSVSVGISGTRLKG